LEEEWELLIFLKYFKDQKGLEYFRFTLGENLF